MAEFLHYIGVANAIGLLRCVKLRKLLFIFLSVFFLSGACFAQTDEESKLFNNYMQKITKKLFKKYNVKERAITYKLVPSRIPNAYCTKYNDGKVTIGITSGLIELFENEDELAYVLGHELVHEEIDKRYNLGATFKGEEFSADAIPVYMLVYGGYNPESASGVFDKIAKSADERAPGDKRQNDIKVSDKLLFEILNDPHGDVKDRQLVVDAILTSIYKKGIKFNKEKTLIDPKIKEVSLRINKEVRAKELETKIKYKIAHDLRSTIIFELKEPDDFRAFADRLIKIYSDGDKVVLTDSPNADPMVLFASELIRTKYVILDRTNRGTYPEKELSESCTHLLYALAYIRESVENGLQVSKEGFNTYLSSGKLMPPVGPYLKGVESSINNFINSKSYDEALKNVQDIIDKTAQLRFNFSDVRDNILNKYDWPSLFNHKMNVDWFEWIKQEFSTNKRSGIAYMMLSLGCSDAILLRLMRDNGQVIYGITLSSEGVFFPYPDVQRIFRLFSPDDERVKEAIKAREDLAYRNASSFKDWMVFWRSKKEFGGKDLSKEAIEHLLEIKGSQTLPAEELKKAYAFLFGLETENRPSDLLINDPLGAFDKSSPSYKDDVRDLLKVFASGPEAVWPGAPELVAKREYNFMRSREERYFEDYLKQIDIAKVLVWLDDIKQFKNLSDVKDMLESISKLPSLLPSMEFYMQYSPEMPEIRESEWTLIVNLCGSVWHIERGDVTKDVIGRFIDFSNKFDLWPRDTKKFDAAYNSLLKLSDVRESSNPLIERNIKNILSETPDMTNRLSSVFYLYKISHSDFVIDHILEIGTGLERSEKIHNIFINYIYEYSKTMYSEQKMDALLDLYMELFVKELPLKEQILKMHSVMARIALEYPANYYVLNKINAWIVDSIRNSGMDFDAKMELITSLLLDPSVYVDKFDPEYKGDEKLSQGDMSSAGLYYKRSNNPSVTKSKQPLLDLLSETLLQKYGLHTDAEDKKAYAQLIKSKVKGLMKNVEIGSGVKYDLGQILARDLVSQEKLSEYLDFYASRKTSVNKIRDVFSFNAHIKASGWEYFFSKYIKTKERAETFIDFLGNPVTEETLTKTVDVFSNEHNNMDQEEKKKLQEELVKRYNDYWYSPFEAQVVIMSKFLKEVSLKWENVFDYLFDKTVIQNGAESDKAKLAFKCYAEALPEYSRFFMFASFLIAGKNDSKGSSGMNDVPTALARIAEYDDNPVVRKLAQQVHSSPYVPNNIRKAFSRFKGHSSEPTRMEVWNLFNTNVPKQIRNKFQYLGKILGAGKSFIVVEGKLKDNGLVAIRLMRDNSDKKIEDSYEILKKAINNMGRHPELNDVLKVLSPLVDNAYEQSSNELDMTRSAEQSELSYKQYKGSSVIIDGVKVEFDPARWMYYGDNMIPDMNDKKVAYSIMELIPNKTFNDLKEQKAEIDFKTIAKAVLAIELGYMLTGNTIDADPHGSNRNVYGDNSVGIFDYGERTIVPPSDEAKLYLGKVIARIYEEALKQNNDVSFIGNVFEAAVLESESMGKEVNSYIRNIYYMMLALNDYIKELDFSTNEDASFIEDLFSSVNKEGYIDEMIRKGFMDNLSVQQKTAIGLKLFGSLFSFVKKEQAPKVKIVFGSESLPIKPKFLPLSEDDVNKLIDESNNAIKNKVKPRKWVKKGKGSRYYEDDDYYEDDYTNDDIYEDDLVKPDRTTLNKLPFDNVTKRSDPASFMSLLQKHMPELCSGNDIEASVDNFMEHIAEEDGALSAKDNIILFGEYGEMGREGGLYDHLAKNEPDLALLIGILVYANELDSERALSEVVRMVFVDNGVMYADGSVKDESRLDIKSLETVSKMTFNPAMMERVTKGTKLIIKR